MFSLKFILLYFVVFFIYINFKLSLLLRFIEYGKQIAKHKQLNDLDHKNKLEIRKKAQEINEVELKLWYEDSVFRKVSQIEYSEKLARSKYEIFLEKELKDYNKIKENASKQKQINISNKKTEEEKEPEEQPLFKIKMKK